MNWKLFAGLAIVGIAGLIIAYNIYNKPHKDIAEAKADHELTLLEVMEEFSDNEMSANSKYTDKVLIIEGNLSDLKEGTPSYLFLEDGTGRVANCEMLTLSENDLARLKALMQEKNSLKIKGLFVGYEDLLGEVQLKKCSILE